MNAFKISWRDSSARLMRQMLALVSMWTLLCGTLAVEVNAQQRRSSSSAQQAGRLSEEQRILHVLNRLGFGARPGDVERVRKMGVEQYIKEQLDPERIPDAVAEAKVRELKSLGMSTAELYAKYPQPGMLLRQMARRGELPAELEDFMRERRGKGASSSPNAGAEAVMQGEDGAMNAQAKDQGAQTDADRREARRSLRDYYLKNGLQTPQRLVAELQASRILRAVYSERQLQEMLVDFWTNHFNIFAGKGADRWLLISYDRDTIRPHTLGTFRDLLQATAESPAMLFYLDNFQSVSPNAPAGRPLGQRPSARRRPFADLALRRSVNTGAARQQGGDVLMSAKRESAQAAKQQKRPKRGINENYARELMELHTLGVDGGYTQRDVQEVARCFTGWTINNPRGRGLNSRDDAGKFYFNPRLHDDGEKLVLGHRIPAGGGVKDGLLVLDILARHPSTAKFIATKLARRFVTDNPGAQLVERGAAAFTQSGGSIRETLRALISSPEFNSTEAYRAKIKTPFELAVSAIRTLGGETNGGAGLHQWIAKMGEGLYQYQAPTGYPDTAEDWVNAGSLLERLNFGLALASNRIPGTRVQLARFLNADAHAGTHASGAALMDRFLNVIVQGDISPGTRKTLLKQLSEPTPAPTSALMKEANTLEQQQSAARPLRRQATRAEAGTNTSDPDVVKVVGLILGSPEFQRQ
jgi:uncharacterized protein (DUF1800 family)